MRLFITLFALLLTGSLSAQVETKPSKPSPAEIAATNAAINTALATANTAAKGDDLNAAEAALVAANKRKPGTADWHMEAAQRLMQVVDQLARETQPKNISALTSRALAHLAQAEGLAKNNAARASIKTFAGQIYERYRADMPAARTHYQAAVALLPADAKSQAKEAVDRIARNESTLRAKGLPTQ